MKGLHRAQTTCAQCCCCCCCCSLSLSLRCVPCRIVLLPHGPDVVVVIIPRSPFFNSFGSRFMVRVTHSENRTLAKLLKLTFSSCFFESTNNGIVPMVVYFLFGLDPIVFLCPSVMCGVCVDGCVVSWGFVFRSCYTSPFVIPFIVAMWTIFQNVVVYFLN
jgi:hypothetical protein